MEASGVRGQSSASGCRSEAMQKRPLATARSHTASWKVRSADEVALRCGFTNGRSPQMFRSMTTKAPCDVLESYRKTCGNRAAQSSASPHSRYSESSLIKIKAFYAQVL